MPGYRGKRAPSTARYDRKRDVYSPVITLRVTAEVRGLLRRLARHTRRSLSEVVRDVLAACAAQEKALRGPLTPEELALGSSRMLPRRKPNATERAKTLAKRARALTQPKK